MKKDPLILVRGGGDLATGTIHRLWSAGLRVLVLEAEHPLKVCVRYGSKLWRRQKKSGNRMPFLFW